nr:DUF6629 family protein [Altererythrobacter sp. ZODW24]
MAIHRARGWKELPYAGIPLIFAAQQFVEGGLWLSLPEQAPSAGVLTISYLLFSNILWPFYLPVAVLMIENDPLRRKRLLVPVIAGAATSVFFLAAISTKPVSAVITGSHINYDLPHPQPALAFTLYAIAVCLAPLLSSHKAVRLFSLAIIVSMIAAYIIYTIWFASVWCYFAALLSGLVLYHFYRRDRLQVEEATSLSA